VPIRVAEADPVEAALGVEATHGAGGDRTGVELSLGHQRVENDGNRRGRMLLSNVHQQLALLVGQDATATLVRPRGGP
jgi:hypothetical protein